MERSILVSSDWNIRDHLKLKYFASIMELKELVLGLRPSPFFFRLLLDAFSNFGSLGRKKEKKHAKIKFESCLELGGLVPQHNIRGA